ncbi:hypothetical protein C8R42DRAFT_586676 [Lentinula raphanica]|nr:hypothetical protein C8R42DRAFT_586676 [Lentinula raphanica]
MLMTLLYQMAEWHALAKLRMHSEDTLEYLETVTRQLGKLMRKFRDLSNTNFETYETEHEGDTQRRRQQQQATGTSKNRQTQGIYRKLLNLLTYKWHALPDYVPSICWFGPTDSTSTQVVRISVASSILLY